MKGRNLSTFSRVGLAAAYHRCAPQSAYVANFDSGTVTPISTRTGTAGPAITVGAQPTAVKRDHTGRPDRLRGQLWL